MFELAPQYIAAATRGAVNERGVGLKDYASSDKLGDREFQEYLGLGQSRVPLKNLSADSLIGRFQQLTRDADRLKSYMGAESDKHRRALDQPYDTPLARAGA